MTDATITVTNLGDRGVRSVFGVIYPPQVALVGFGKISDRVWDVDDGIGIRPAVTATLSADHRATDGHIGARFLAERRPPPAPPGGAVMTLDPDTAMRDGAGHDRARGRPRRRSLPTTTSRRRSTSTRWTS